MITCVRLLLIVTVISVRIVYAKPILYPRILHAVSSNATEEITTGWTSSPNNRGTIDIIWSCIVTMFLCSWSVLCLQIPSKRDTKFDLLWRRAWLTALCALGPEITMQLALGQWSSARQSVRDFHASEFTDWTMKHAFYADSGGFFLHTPDFKPIPIDAKQLLYLINHKYIKYPTITEQDIDDKNKVDILLRIISVGQTIWFSATMFARAAQGLVITGMELTTAAFILCSFGTTFCWWNKGADVTTPIPLVTETTMADILKEGGDGAGKPYHRTPLDFISREEWHWSLYWTHWINILRRMHINFAPKALPHDRIENTLWLDLKARGALPALGFMCLAYSSIFIAGWNDFFPSTLERQLWRVSSLSMMATLSLYFVVTGFAYVAYPAMKRFIDSKKSPKSESSTRDTSQPFTTENIALGNQLESSEIHSQKPSRIRAILSRWARGLRNNSILKDPSLDVPLKATLPMYVVAFIYCCSRLTIFLLDIVQLRALPVTAYETVDWGAFVPHLA